MKALAIVLACAGSLYALPRLTPNMAEVVQVGDVAPEVGGEWLQSEVNSLAACRGRVVLIEFWRTW